MSDQTDTPDTPDTTESTDLVTVHLDVLGRSDVYVQTVALGAPGVSPSILLRTDLSEEGDLEVTATIPATLGSDLDGVDLLLTIAESFHAAVQKARPSLVERLIQPTAPEDTAEDANEPETATEPSA